MIFLALTHTIPNIISSIFIFTSVLALVWYIQVLITHRHFYRILEKIHGPPALPVIGHLYLAIGTIKNTLNNALRICEDYPSPIKLWMATEVNILVTKPEQMQIVLNSPNALEKHIYYTFLKLDNGLIAQPGNLWKHDRKIINPAFNTKILETFIGTYEEKSKKLLLNLDKQAGKDVFNIGTFISQYVMDVLCATVLGVNAENENLPMLVKTLQRYEEIITARILTRTYWINFIYNLTKLSKEEKQCLNDMNQFIDKIIKKRTRNQTEQANSNKQDHSENEDDTHNNVRKRKILVDLLLESENENKLSNERLRDQLLLFFIAGTDTTSIVTSFVLMMLGMYPEIQDKVYEEINEFYSDSDTVVTSQHLSRMNYTEMVIKETMRIFPPLSFIGRQTTKEINFGNVRVPAGVNIILSIISMHRNHTLWPHPMKFDPDRFLPENSKERHPYSFIPFSGGPRNCIGYKLAMLSMKTLLILIVKKFKIKCPYKSPSDIKIRIDMLLRPSRGHLVSLEYRNCDSQK